MMVDHKKVNGSARPGEQAARSGAAAGKVKAGLAAGSGGGHFQFISWRRRGRTLDVAA